MLDVWVLYEEYRMVKKTLQITQDKKENLIALYDKTNGHISDCCRAVRISRRTYYNWLDNDEKFLMRIADKEAELNDEMRQALIDKAGSGDLGAIIFYLKKLHPDFTDRNIKNLTKIDVKEMSVSFIKDESKTQ